MRIAFIFGPSGANENMKPTIDLYQRDPHVRRVFDQAGEWTGFGVDALLTQHNPPEDVSLMRLNTIVIAASMLGITDALGAAGIRPTVVGGISLGGWVSGCVAGTLSQRQLIEMLVHEDHRPASDAADRSEAFAFVQVPADQDPIQYSRMQSRGIFLASDFGIVASGVSRLLMISGYRDALEKLAVHDENKVTVREKHLICAAYHSPLRQRARTLMTPLLDGMGFRNPRVPVCSGIDGSTLLTADGVRNLFLRNFVEPLHVSSLFAGIATHRPELVLAIGSSMRPDLFTYPFPVVHVATYEDIEDTVRSTLRRAAPLLVAPR